MSFAPFRFSSPFQAHAFMGLSCRTCYEYDFSEKKYPENATILVLAHSDGTTVTHNALRLCPPQVQQRVYVVAVAPARYISTQVCADVMHYRAPASRDFVPRIDRVGAERAAGTVIDLPSHPDAPWFDHDFMSPTYTDRIQQHIATYIASHGGRM